MNFGTGWKRIQIYFGGTQPMSESGQSRRFDDVRVMSAFLLIATEERTSRDVSKVPIVLQNSQNAVLPISRKQTKRAEIAERYSLQAVTEVACELWQDDVVPHIIIRSPRLRSRKLCSVMQKDFCNTICHEQT